MTDQVLIRPIQAADNAEIARIIKSVLTEFGANKPGTVFTDPTTDQLFELFQSPNSSYFIALENDKMIGGCGIFPTKGLPAGCVELVKLYITAEWRGKGIGYQLMEKCIAHAQALNFKEIYLETLPELHIAVGLYENMGFQYLEQPYGDSGHFACDLWLSKKI
ncbi:MAG: GNAT family N-acetyltransferase [Fluviicola sp.]|nr:GNAT family N-acetyltransferase [Fluviicola sp.]MBP6272832.1 GNAT family N-acetyltransferase [Fluviicola sp.]